MGGGLVIRQWEDAQVGGRHVDGWEGRRVQSRDTGGRQLEGIFGGLCPAPQTEIHSRLKCSFSKF